MLDSIQAFHEVLNHQQGINDGISLAYHVDTKEITIGMALEAAKFNNEFYLHGLVEGFKTIQEAIDKNVTEEENVQKTE